MLGARGQLAEGRPLAARVVNDATLDAAPMEVDLKQGWNVLLVKVANGGKTASLGLRVAGDGLRTAAAPDSSTTSGGQ